MYASLSLTCTVLQLVLTSGLVLQLLNFCLQLILILLHSLLSFLEESLHNLLHLLRTDTWFSCHYEMHGVPYMCISVHTKSTAYIHVRTYMYMYPSVHMYMHTVCVCIRTLLHAALKVCICTHRLTWTLHKL